MSNKPKGQWYGGRYYPANNRLNTPYFDQRNNLPISLQPSENRKHGSYQTTFQVNSYIGGPGTSYGPAKMDYNGTSARQGMEFTGNENDITRGGPYEFKMPSRKDQGMYTCWTCNPPRDFNSSQALNSHRGQVGHLGMVLGNQMPFGRGEFNSQSRRMRLGMRHYYSSFVQGMVYSKLSTRFPSVAMEL